MKLTKFSKAFIAMAVGEIGEDRFLFGTDYPFIISDPSYIEALGLSRQQKDKILGGNAARLFAKRLDRPQAATARTG